MRGVAFVLAVLAAVVLGGCVTSFEDGSAVVSVSGHPVLARDAESGAWRVLDGRR
ncbi:MAG TPA: hypothetical protein VNO86_05060 [Candidatus Binatia bacterium]|nr:hypothetical protein [Candidatus Binatia bacterium]